MPSPVCESYSPPARPAWNARPTTRSIASPPDSQPSLFRWHHADLSVALERGKLDSGDPVDARVEARFLKQILPRDAVRAHPIPTWRSTADDDIGPALNPHGEPGDSE